MYFASVEMATRIFSRMLKSRFIIFEFVLTLIMVSPLEGLFGCFCSVESEIVSKNKLNARELMFLARVITFFTSGNIGLSVS